jgi:hypothetical protein
MNRGAGVFAVFVVAGQLLAACAGQIPPPTEADVLRAATGFPGTTLADLDLGRSLYVGHCSGCHNLHRPDAYSPDKWPGMIDEMREKAKLEPAEAVYVTRYLVVAAGAPAKR